MWNVLKFTYSHLGETEVRTKIKAYLHLEEAEAMFDHLRLACQLGIPLTVKGGARIGISGVCLYTALREDRAAAEKEVRDGLGRLIQDAHEIVLDLDEAGPAGANR